MIIFVINGILFHETVIVKAKHIILLKKRVLTKKFTVFIKFWRFNSFFVKPLLWRHDQKKLMPKDFVFYVDGNQWRLVTFGLDSAAEPKSKYIHGVTEKSAFVLTGNGTHQLQQIF
jgi:hypothetical protein